MWYVIPQIVFWHKDVGGFLATTEGLDFWKASYRSVGSLGA